MLDGVVRQIVAALVESYGRWQPAARRDAARVPKGPYTTEAEVLSGRRRRPAVEVRWAAWLYLYDRLGWTMRQIAAAWGRTSHGAVSRGVTQASRTPAIASLVAVLGA